MSLKIKCRCGERLTAPESAAGKRGKCSKCGATFVIPAPKAAATASKLHGESPAGAGADLPELPDLKAGHADLSDDLGDLLDEAINAPALPAKERPADSTTASNKHQPEDRATTRSQFTRLANGIKLVFWGTLLGVSSILLPFLGALTGPAGLALAVLAAVVMSLVGGLISTVGRVMCLAVPEKVGAKAFIYAAVACDLASVATQTAGAFVTLPAWFGPLSSALWLGTLGFFVLFLKAVATFIGQEHLAEDARVIPIVVAISITAFLTPPLAAFVFPPLVLLSLPLVLLGIGAMIYAVFKYLYLLQHVAERVRP